MLQPVNELLTGDEMIDIGLFTTFDAVCLGTGAHLSRGRSDNWTLILPDRVPAARIDFFRHSAWTYRAQFKAPSLRAAIEIGNRRLATLRQRQAASQL